MYRTITGYRRVAYKAFSARRLRLVEYANVFLADLRAASWCVRGHSSMTVWRPARDMGGGTAGDAGNVSPAIVR